MDALPTAQQFDRTSVDWILARTNPTPPALRWGWERADEIAEEDEERCANPACHGLLLTAKEDGEHLVHDGGDSRIRVCSRACAAAIEHCAGVRAERARARRRSTNPRVAAEATSIEMVARACRFATGRATPADRFALFYVGISVLDRTWATDREIVLRYARLAQIDRDLALYGRSPKPPAAELA